MIIEQEVCNQCGKLRGIDDCEWIHQFPNLDFCSDTCYTEWVSDLYSGHRGIIDLRTKSEPLSPDLSCWYTDQDEPERNCETCACSVPFEHPIERGYPLDCRRFPSHGEHRLDDWCGEWKAKEE